MVEKRKFKRLKASFIVVYRLRRPLDILMIIGNEEVSGIMFDLSEGGISIASDYDIPPGTTLSIEFTLINPYASRDEQVKRIEVSGEVRNKTVTDSGENRLGIQFTNIAEEDRKALTDFVTTS